MRSCCRRGPAIDLVLAPLQVSDRGRIPADVVRRYQAEVGSTR